jgi:hypothetical protein
LTLLDAVVPLLDTLGLLAPWFGEFTRPAPCPGLVPSPSPERLPFGCAGETAGFLLNDGVLGAVTGELSGAGVFRTPMIASLKSLSPPPAKSSKPICVLSAVALTLACSKLSGLFDADPVL